MKHVMLKYMYVQDVVAKKLTNLAYINTKQNKIETHLKQNREVTEQREDETKRGKREKKSISSDEEEMRT